MKTKIIHRARKVNKIRFISGIAICSLVVLLTFVVLVLNLVDYYNYDSPESGINNLRMFTTLSNIIAAVAALMCLPFQIDGLRRDKYHLPYWIVILMYVGAVGVFLTFSIALTLISAFQGFTKTMFMKSNLFLHTINPILITLVFTLVISDSRIKFAHSFLALMPLSIYMIIYFIMVFVAKVWNDHYKTNAFFPWPISLLMMVTVTFGISQLIRILHNLTNKFVTRNIERYYKESPDFEFPLVSNAIAHLAKLESKFYYEGDDLYMPVDIIQLLSDRYSASKVPVDILYDIYLESYLISIGKKTNDQGSNLKLGE